MSHRIETHGLTPRRKWKFGEYDGWGVLVTREYNDEEDHFVVKIAISSDELDELAMAITTKTEEACDGIFDAFRFDEPENVRKAIQGVLDHSGPLIRVMIVNEVQA